MEAALSAMNDAFGLGYSHSVLERTIHSEELERHGEAPPRHVHSATAVVRITVRIGEEVCIHEAMGTSCIFTTADNRFVGRGNALKAAESDGFKRAARFFGQACSTAATESPGHLGYLNLNPKAP